MTYHNFQLILFLFTCITLNAQVGINTSNPTKTLDVNGELRVRNTPSAVGAGNKVLAVDANGNVQTLNTSDLNINKQGAYKDITLTTSGAAGTRELDYTYFSLIIPKKSLVNISYNTSFEKMLQEDGSNLLDGTSFAYFTILFITDASGAYKRIYNDTRPFSNSKDNYIQGKLYSGGSVWRQLDAGSYTIVVQRSVFKNPGNANANGNGFQAYSNGRDSSNFLQVVTFPN